MYLRTTQRRNKDGSVVRYLALAENVRDAGKGYVEARVVHSFGRADELDRVALERLVRSIRRVLDEGSPAAADKPPGGQPAGDLAIDKVDELGIAHVAGTLWQELGIGAAIRSRLKARKLAAPHEAALLAMTVQRLDEPGSKLACWQSWLDGVWLPEARDLGLDQLYRALDVLALEAEAIEQEVFWHAVDLFKLEVDLVFYDATTALRRLLTALAAQSDPPAAAADGLPLRTRTSPSRPGAASPFRRCASAATARRGGTIGGSSRPIRLQSSGHQETPEATPR